MPTKETLHELMKSTILGQPTHSDATECGTRSEEIVILKIGGSSITDKASFETLNEKSLEWFAQTISKCLGERFLAVDLNVNSSESDSSSSSSSSSTASSSSKPSKSFIIIHGAGSFGHHTAKQYGLKGRDSPPSEDKIDLAKELSDSDRRTSITGLAKTRHSVKKLNSAVVSHLLNSGINAVGISPCINIPGLHAHGGNEYGGVNTLVQSIHESLMAGLIPVIHGDAGLWGEKSAGILGGDTLVEIIATHEILHDHVTKVIFLTDVDGVYTKDPNTFDDASLVRVIDIDPLNGNVMCDLSASGSSHEHDVTGGLETKLGAAANVASIGIEVNIAKCSSEAAEQALLGLPMHPSGTVIRRKK